MRRFAILLVAVFGGCLSEAPAAETTDPIQETSSDLGVFLTQQGYARVPMIRLSTGNYSISGTVDDVPMDLIVDTGASHTVIDVLRADRFDLLTEDRGNRATGLGATSQRVESGQLGNVAIGPIQFDSLPVTVLDLSHLNQVLRRFGHPPVDGILGADVFLPLRAIIDYGSMSIYLKEAE